MAIDHLAEREGAERQIVASDDPHTIPLRAETITVAKRVHKTSVKATTITNTRDVLVDEALACGQVVVERVAVGRVVDEIPPVRQEGDVTVLPVVEEEIVITRRLILREEVHLRRFHTTQRHVETVKLREQSVSVTRTPLEDDTTSSHPAVGTTSGMKEHPMSDETIVAIYDTHAHAELAAADLVQAGVPQSAISVHANSTGAMTTTTATVPREEGFWATLFGGEPDHDTAVYDRSMDSGSTVVTVKVPEPHIAKVMEILESHKPIDIDDRATSYGMTQTTTAAAAPVMPVTTGATVRTDTVATDGVLQLSEESLAVGKRVVNRGGTRIRRFVVETPVEESVNLHSEKVVLERRPVTDGRPVSDSFSEKTIEMTEMAEEAVVSKTAHVYEEVGLRKEATDRTETVRDTVRKEEVEIEQIPGSVTTETSSPLDPRSPKI